MGSKDSQRTEAKRPERVGIIWGSGLGDFLVIYPLIRFLTAEKRAEVTYFTSHIRIPDVLEKAAAGESLLSVELVAKTPQSFALVWRYWKYFDSVFVMENRWSFWNRLLAFALSPRKLCAPVPGTEFIGSQVRKHVHRCFGWRWEESGDGLPFPLNPSERVMEFRRRHSDYFVLHPSERPDWRTKSWPEVKWAELIKRLLDKVDLDLCLVGLAVDQESYQRIIERLPLSQRGRVHVIVDWSLGEVAAVLKASRGLICHNSGLMHMAAELKLPTLVLNGSSALYWQRGEPWVKNITSGSCMLHCNRRRCPVPGFNSKCIRDISVGTVLEHLNEVLS